MENTDYLKSLYRSNGYVPLRRKFMKLKSSGETLLVTVWVHVPNGQQKVFDGENFLPPELFEEEEIEESEVNNGSIWY